MESTDSYDDDILCSPAIVGGLPSAILVCLIRSQERVRNTYQVSQSPVPAVRFTVRFIFGHHLHM